MEIDQIESKDLMPASSDFCRGLRLVLLSGNYNYTKDGVAFTLNKLVQYLEQNGAEVMILSPARSEPAFTTYGTVTNVPSLPLPFRSEYRVALPLPRHLRQRIRAFRPNLFHIATPDPLGYSAMLLARQLGVPAVASYHSRIDLYFQYYRLGFVANLFQLYLRIFYKSCDQMYAPTAEVVEMVRTSGLARDVRLWSRGVDTEQFNPSRRSLEWRRAHGFQDDEVIICFVSRLVAEKNLGLLSEILRELERRGIRHRQLIVGQGPERNRLAAALPRAVFTGHLEGSELATAYASSDVFLFPSTIETFGNVTLEAMASGLPTVCAMAPGSMSLVVNGETGLLIEDRDVAGFCNAIEQLVVSPAVRKKLGSAGTRRSQTFTWAAVMDSLVGHYREIVERTRSTSS